MRGEWDIDSEPLLARSVALQAWSTCRTEDRPPASVASCAETAFVDEGTHVQCYGMLMQEIRAPHRSRQLSEAIASEAEPGMFVLPSDVQN